MRSPAARLRLIGLAEGFSFLILLGVAMPLKYFADLPVAVQIAGWAHGALFIGLCGSLLQVMMSGNWPFNRALVIFVAALVPLGPFLLDRRMKHWISEWTHE